MQLADTLGVRAQQKELTRKDILQSALSIFSEKGFDGASIRDISAQAGVNHAMVKYHFNNKENLWKEAVRFLFSRCDEEVSISPEEAENLNALEATELFFRKYIRYCAKRPEHARIMVQASIRDDELLTWIVKEFIKEQHGFFLEMFGGLQLAQVWPKGMSPIFLVYITVSVSQTIFMLAPEVKKIHGIDPQAEDMIEKYADSVIHLFFRHTSELA